MRLKNVLLLFDYNSNSISVGIQQVSTKLLLRLYAVTGHLFSNLIRLVQLSYVGKLSISENDEFVLKLQTLWHAAMLKYQPN